MKKILILIGIALLALLNACASSTEKSFNKYGISFTCPAEWAVTETENEDGLTSVTVEKTGKTSSGIVMIVIVDAEVEHSDLTEIYFNSLENSGFADMVFREFDKISYGTYSMTSTSYQGNMQGLALRGNFYSMIIGEQTIYVIEQEAIEDIAVNKLGFERIKETLMFFAE